MKVRFLTPCLMYRDVYMQRKNVYIVIKHTDICHIIVLCGSSKHGFQLWTIEITIRHLISLLGNCSSKRDI